MSIQPNPLAKFASYNYRYKLGVVSPDKVNNPELYIENGPDVTIIASGGAAGKNVTTFAEEQLGVNVEFFIDDFSSEYLVVPNQATSVSNQIQFEFKVTEPLSVGLFFQTIKLAVNQVYNSEFSYLEVPFLLELDFVGYDDDGNIFQGAEYGIPKHSLLIKLTNVTFNVDQSGSIYTVTGMPWNHLALTNNASKIQTDFKLAGDTVEAMLEGSENSLTARLNKIEKELEATAGQEGRHKIVGNRYRISFPNDPSTKQPTLDLFQVNTSNDPREIERRANGNFVNNSDDLNAHLANDTARTYSATPTTIMTPGGPEEIVQGASELLQRQNALSQVRTSSATASGSVNYLGQSAIITDFTDYGTNPFGIDSVVFNFDEGDDDRIGDEIYTRGPLTIDANTREFQFDIGTKISKIIADVILSSDWGLNLINQKPDDKGNIEWFKIHTDTKIRGIEELKNTGNLAFDYNFIVTPYKTDASIIAGNTVAHNYTAKIADCVKSYQYIYTGLNQDIINFEFNIDNAFYKEIFRSNEGNIDNAADGGTAVTTDVVEKHVGRNSVTNGAGLASMGAKAAIVPSASTSGGSGARTSKREVADLFANAVLNSDIDMVTLDLKIWGDPYYFMDSDVGNQRTPSGGNPNVTIDGKIDPARNEVYVLIQFKSAVDYNGNILQMDPTNLFSGIYKVVTFTNDLSGGLFTQTLNLIRMPNQTEESVEASNSIVTANAQGNLPLVLSNLQTESANRAADFEALVQQASDLQTLQTAFSQAGIQDFEKILNGGQIFDIAQNLGGAFNQLATAQQGFQAALNVLNGGLPGLLNRAIGDTNLGQTVNKVTNIRNNVNNIRNDIRGLF